MRARRAESQAGVVLITVLLLVATMSALAVGFVEAMRLDIARTQHGRAHVQARWYAFGAEQYAEILLQRLWAAQGDAPQLQRDWANPGLRLPIEGGLMVVRIAEGANCFNLNSVVRAGPDGFRLDPVGFAQLRTLLEAIDLAPGEARSLAASVLDWIDSDGTPFPGGAEDATYANGEPAYRTGNTLLADASELRVIQGFDLPLYRRLRPLVCALPTTDLSPFNLNTLRPDQAPLLSALTRGEISVERARGVIEDRPRGGYGSMQQFWRQDAFAGIALSERLRGQPALRSRYIRLITEVSLDDSTLAMDALLEQLGGGTIRVLRRSFGWPDTLRPDEI